MPSAQLSWYGKLPSHGDFLQRRAPEPFVRVWDEWLQGCIAHSKAQLGGEWLNAYLTSPVWRFFVSEGVAGDASYAGVLLPSVDRVGRYFPLTIFAQLPAGLPPMAVAIQGRAWLRQIEELALQALEAEDLSIEAFDAKVCATAELLSAIEQYYGTDVGEGFPSQARHWRLPMASVDRMPAALIDPLVRGLAQQLQPLTLWWTDGSERIGASCLLSRSLPDAARFVAMLDGDWADAGWRGEFGDLQVEAPPPFVAYRIASAAISDVGSVRAVNQDRVLERPDAGLWAIADGMGGHSRGEYASQLIVDVLNSAPPGATLASAMETARESLERANDDLARAALNATDGARSGSTVVALSIRQGSWGVLWAGDSRAYLLRDGVLTALTRDHADGAEEEFDAAAPAPSGGEITRAVGGAEQLELDRVMGALRPADRFLLCSDGLHGVVPHERITRVVVEHRDPQLAAQALLKEALSSGSRDNISVVLVDVVEEAPNG
jgi:type VI secretion system protein ImpM